MTAKKEDKKAAKEEKTPQVSKDEQIGYHKGCLTTLAKERQELARVVGICDQLMQFHLGALKELGLDLTKQAEVQEAMGTTPRKSEGGKKKPIDEII